jgi:hypothetical protein
MAEIEREIFIIQFYSCEHSQKIDLQMYVLQEKTKHKKLEKVPIYDQKIINFSCSLAKLK